MGYYTFYAISTFEELTETEKNIVVDFFTQKDLIDYVFDSDLGTYGEAKWYEHNEDMLELSKILPHVTFELDGEGEENGDLWRTYYKNGKKQFCPARIEYDDFDADLLK